MRAYDTVKFSNVDKFARATAVFNDSHIGGSELGFFFSRRILLYRGYRETKQH